MTPPPIDAATVAHIKWILTAAHKRGWIPSIKNELFAHAHALIAAAEENVMMRDLLDRAHRYIVVLRQRVYSSMKPTYDELNEFGGACIADLDQAQRDGVIPNWHCTPRPPLRMSPRDERARVAELEEK